MNSHKPYLRWPRLPLLACAAAVALFGSFVPAAKAQNAPLILNEYSAVDAGKYLDGGDYRDATDKIDTYFQSIMQLADAQNDGRIEGNGGNWIELVVIEDHLDIRGWSLRWAEPGATDTDGADIWFGDSGVEQGEIAFSSTAALWSDLRAGTIISISEKDSIEVDTDWDTEGDDRNFTRNIDPLDVDVTIDLSTDTGYNPAGDDWWIHVSSRGEHGQADPLVTTVTNVNGDLPGDFSVGPDEWELTVVDSDLNDVFGPIGEDINDWGGGGLNDRESGRLEVDPSASVSGAEFDDSTSTTFGHPNEWAGVLQDFTTLRPTDVEPITLTWDGSGDGMWNSPTQWTGGDAGAVPSTSTAVVVQTNLVTVGTHASAASLTVNSGGIAIAVGETLAVGGDANFAADATLSLGPVATLSVDGDAVLNSTIDVEIVGPDSGQISVTGEASIGGPLTLHALAGLGTVGDASRPILTADGGVTGTFLELPAPGNHLGYGVFHQGITSSANSVSVNLLQAAAGDTDGNREVNNTDLQLILGAGSFNNGTGFEWTQGDFDGDTDVDNSDLQLVLATGLFGTGPYAAVAPEAASGSLNAVPEPSTLALALAGVAALLLVLRRRTQ